MSLGFPMLARDRHASLHVWLTITAPHPLIFVSLSFQIKLKSFALIDFCKSMLLSGLGARRGRGGLNGLDGGTWTGEEQEAKMAQSSWLEGCAPPSR